MNAIGGYFGLELRAGRAYHAGAIALNTARNAFEYILKAKGYRRVFMPYYTCHVMLQPVNRLQIKVEYYHIDEQLEPVFDFGQLQPDDAFLYTNYFGLKGGYLQTARALADSRLIVDNAQAFFAPPLPDTDTFYSARKFFGVPDGAYLYTDTTLQEQPAKDMSYERFAHLLIRADRDAEPGYASFVQNDAALDNQPIRTMSNITSGLLAGVDYEACAAVRRRNYTYLHQALGAQNLLQIAAAPGDEAVPMVYPFLSTDTGLRARLIQSRVYVAQYWPEVLQQPAASALEHQLTAGLIPLPVDQRLSETDLNYIINIIQHAH